MTDLARVQVNAPQAEIDRWDKCAKREQRSLSAWLRQLANAAANPSARYRLPGTFDVKDDGDPMHSHDRTLISKLGFGDADKSNDRHDLACQYLTTEASAVFGLKGACRGWLEQPLNKGDGKYKTTIGFVDVCGLIDGPAPTAEEKRLLDADSGADFSDEEFKAYEVAAKRTCARAFVIEVKIKPVGVGDMLRQVALYREYASNLECLNLGDYDRVDLWGLVADFDLNDSALNALEAADVKFARLGPSFEKWLKQTGTKSSKKVKVL